MIRPPVGGPARALLEPLVRRARSLPVRAARLRWGLAPAVGNVALTFDDGPDPRFTPALLDVLADLDVPATFFLVGRRAERHPELVARILREGHVVASHSWSHPDPRKRTFAQLVREYGRGRRAVEAAAGAPVRMFRPPMGEIGRSSVTAAAVCGLHPWLWTRDPRDWLPGRTTEEILDDLGVLRAGDVVLLHDGIELPQSDEALDRSATVAAVPELVRRVRTAGLALVSLPVGPPPWSRSGCPSPPQ